MVTGCATIINLYLWSHLTSYGTWHLTVFPSSLSDNPSELLLVSLWKHISVALETFWNASMVQNVLKLSFFFFFYTSSLLWLCLALLAKCLLSRRLSPDSFMIASYARSRQRAWVRPSHQHMTDSETTTGWECSEWTRAWSAFCRSEIALIPAVAGVLNSISQSGKIKNWDEETGQTQYLLKNWVQLCMFFPSLQICNVDA